jgi:dihydrolipoamide dehydrogenase
MKWGFDPMDTKKIDVLVVGGGPGGYAAAFYAAERGRHVTLIEREFPLGGDCLKRGCIPSKAFLHATELLKETRRSIERGIAFGQPRIDSTKLRSWKDEIVGKLGKGVLGLAQGRGVEVVAGNGIFEDSRTVRVETEEGQSYFEFQEAIIAVGARPSIPPSFDLGNPRVMTSSEALALPGTHERMLVIGGGYIGLEMGTIYARLGTTVVLVEVLDALMSGVDADLIKPVAAEAKKLFQRVRLSTRVKEMATSGHQIRVVLESKSGPVEEFFDRVLLAVGRQPNSDQLGLENTRVKLDRQGFIEVGWDKRTSEPHIYAIGDAVGAPQLAHKAFREGRIAVDAILGEELPGRDMLVPAVVYTDPEIAWAGLTENEARVKRIDVEVARFPWSASGRALTFDRSDGMTKLLFNPETERIVGAGVVGPRAGELIAEAVLAIEMGATARDLAETIHPHPTLSETWMECAESIYGTATHYSPRRKG